MTQRKLVSPYPIRVEEAPKVERRDVRPPKPPKPVWWAQAENILAGVGFGVVTYYGFGATIDAAQVAGYVSCGVLMVVRFALDEPSELIVRATEGLVIGIKSPVMAAHRLSLYIDNVALAKELDKAERQIEYLERANATLTNQLGKSGQVKASGAPVKVEPLPPTIQEIDWEDPYGNVLESQELQGYRGADSVAVSPFDDEPVIVTDERPALAHRLIEVYRETGGISKRKATQQAAVTMTRGEWETARDYLLDAGTLAQSQNGGYELAVDDIEAEKLINALAQENELKSRDGMVTP